LIERPEERLWTVRQIIVDPNDDNLWVLEGRVDLSRPRDETRPLLELDRIGS
jgi:hypothetical protein